MGKLQRLFLLFIKASWLQPDKNNRHQCICWFITNANNVSTVNTYGNEGIRNAFISFDYENKRQKDYQMKIAWFFLKHMHWKPVKQLFPSLKQKQKWKIQ